MTVAVFCLFIFLYFLIFSLYIYIYNLYIFLIFLLSLKFRYFLVMTKTSLKTEYKFVLGETCAQRTMMQKVIISATSGLPTQATEYSQSS